MQSRNSLPMMMAGPGGTSCKLVEMPKRPRLQPVFLRAAQGWACFDQRDLGGVGEAPDRFGCAHDVSHHRAAAGAEFDDPDLARAAQPHPFVRCPETKQFAEHLAGFRRGGEIRVEARTRRVIAVARVVQAHQHVERDGHRSVRADGVDYACAKVLTRASQPADLSAPARSAMRRRRSSGSTAACPWSGTTGRPSTKESGSRKFSTKVRQTA